MRSLLTKKVVLLAAYILLGIVVCTSQTNTPTTKNRDFWVMFLYNHNYNSGYHPEQQRLYIMGDQTTNVNITNNTTGTTTTTLQSPSFFTVQQCSNTSMQIATVFDGGYHITTDQDVWVYANDYIDHNQDVALILPTQALDTYYIVQDYPSTNDRGAEVGIVATEDNTVVTMTVPCNVLNTTITAGTTLNINLNSGQAYMLLAAAGGSFSGMEVSSNGKPFALFVAGQNTAVPTNGNGRDFTYDQSVPIRYWGSEFVVGGTSPQSANKLRITSSDDNCMINRNGTTLTGPLQKGQTFETDFQPSDTWHIVASKPVQVTLYMGSYGSSGNVGDPSAITIPPIDKGLNDYYFPIINSPATSTHYVYLICPQNYDAGLTLDNNALPTTGVSTIGSYKCHRLTIPSGSNDGVHRLQNSLGPFVAYAYGPGHDWESYGFPLGMKFATIVNDTTYDTITYYDTICVGVDYAGYGFSLSAANNHNPGTIIMMRDETLGDTVTHHILYLTVLPHSQSVVYDTITFGDTLLFGDTILTIAGDYTILLTASNGCDSVVTLHLTFTVCDTAYLYDTICAGETYNNYEWTLVSDQLSVGDTVMSHMTTVGGVPTFCILRLTVLPVFSTEITESLINGDTLAYNDTLITLAGDYIFHLTAANGCDSTVILHLGYAAIGITASADGICPGSEVVLTASGTHTFIWNSIPYDPELDNLQGQNPITIHPTTTTTYQLLDGAGNVICSTTVGTAPPPSLCVETNRTFVDFDYPKVVFTDCSEGRHHSTWYFSDGITSHNEHVVRVFDSPLPDSVEITLISCNRYNCCSDTTFWIPCRIRSLWFPNIFTPGAESNNLFRCFTSRDIVEFEIDIYNRWGLHLWSTTDPNQGWDGRRTDGTPCTQGAYVYKYYWRDADGDAKNGIGTVTIIR